MNLPRRIVIFRSSVWHGVGLVLLTMVGLCAALPAVFKTVQPPLRAPAQRAEIHIRLSDFSIMGTHATHLLPSEDVAVVTFETWLNVRTWSGLARRQENTYWMVDHVRLPTGETVDARDADKELLAAAHVAFALVLSTSATRTVTTSGQPTWVDVTTSLDVRHGIYVVLIWTWIVLLAMTTVLCAVCVFLEQRARNRLAHQRCWRCGYDRSGSPGKICEECGEADQASV